MNQPPSDMYYPSHMSTPQGPPSQGAGATGMNHYAHHAQPPPLMQSGAGQYSPAQASYGSYGYSNGLTSPQQAAHQVSNQLGVSQGMSLPPMTSNQQPVMPGQSYPTQQGFDTTGQIAPPGMKPRVTATLWEDEGSLCFQVEAKGVCVARREDNHMINGTKLLNVAGMTRGRRDGILKSEKMRHVVKIGPMHLKGVWIPFERALDFANKEKITELLYPLFVHNIGALLYHPTNQNRTNVVMAAAERRKAEQSQLRNPQTSGLPSLQSHHHHSMQTPAGPNQLSGAAHALPHSGIGRPDMQRAHTFPTPPTSASSVMGPMASSDSANFQWSGQGIGAVPGSNPLAIETGINNARSMPTTPATTPPGPPVQGMSAYQTQQPYDTSRQLYSAPPIPQTSYPQQSGTPQQNMSRYAHNTSYVKHEMPPPGTRPQDNGAPMDHHDGKAVNGIMHHGQNNEHGSHGAGDEEAEHEHDAEYTHDNHVAYDAGRASYGYAGDPAANGLQGEHAHLSQDLTASPSNPGGSGRATPRTAAVPQPYYAQQSGYSTPPRVQPPSSNLYSVMSSERGTAPGSGGSDVYAPHAEMTAPMNNGYQQHPVVNGGMTNGKRARDDDDEAGRPSSRAGDIDALKRRKTMRENSGSGPVFESPQNRARNPIVQRRR